MGLAAALAAPRRVRVKREAKTRRVKSELAPEFTAPQLGHGEERSPWTRWTDTEQAVIREALGSGGPTAAAVALALRLLPGRTRSQVRSRMRQCHATAQSSSRSKGPRALHLWTQAEDAALILHLNQAAQPTAAQIARMGSIPGRDARAISQRIQYLRDKKKLTLKDGVYSLTLEQPGTNATAAPPSRVLRRLWTDEEDGRLLKAMNAARSAKPEDILRTRLLPNRTSTQIAARLEHLASRISLSADGQYSLEPAVPDGHHKGQWTKEELNSLQKALSLTRNGTAPEVKATGLLKRSVDQIQKKMKQLRDRGLLVKDERGYRITQPSREQLPDKEGLLVKDEDG
eukprot:GHVT01099853.1.p1 GENE.GHVT01099853.1~~GHVT01099853.1.p1  ORF type:complete len:344 (-),score=43.48 GHVT01099853.1:261-1292(-)